MKMNWRPVISAAAIALAFPAVPAWGHGTPIVVHLVNNQLSVSDGLADAANYADRVFADEDPEAWLTPGPNSTQLTTLPGFELHDLQVGATLSLEVLSRPDFTQAARPQRWLWHWNQAAGAVTIAENSPSLALASLRGFVPNVTLVQHAPPTPNVLKVADVLGTDLGQHRHMVLYSLDDSLGAEAGVYAFFARLTSPTSQPSAPFLVALNLGLDDAITFQAGAMAINAAAGLGGDFDVDGDADGADFLLWQRTLGSTTQLAADASLDDVINAPDLMIWREDFGVPFPSSLQSAASSGSSAAEPAGSSIAVVAIAGLRLMRRRPAASRHGLPRVKTDFRG